MSVATTTSSTIRVRCYNVGQGECVLVTLSERERCCHMLIDFGSTSSNSNPVLEAIARDILQETDGHLDVVVLTHHHLDRLGGFYAQRAIFERFQVGQVWMGLPSHPDYDNLYPNARPLRQLRAAAQRFLGHCQRRNLVLAPSFHATLANNVSISHCVDYVRTLAGQPSRVLYLKRGDTVTGEPLPSSLRVNILAPEEDVSVYFGSSVPQLGANRRSLLATAATDIDEDDRRWLFKGVPRDADGLPDNLSPADWRQLRASIRTAAVDAVRALDQIENNSSLVLLLEVAGKRLLFAGDVESECWNVMYGEVKQQLKNVDFLKLTHHGRLAAVPDGLLDELLPIGRKNLATVIVSNMDSLPGAQCKTQHDEILHKLKQRCRKVISVDGDQALFVDVKL